MPRQPSRAHGPARQPNPRSRAPGEWIMAVGDAVAVADVDNDGALDIFLTYPLKDSSSRAALFLNTGEFRFRRQPIAALDEYLSNPVKHGLPSGAM